MTRLSQSVEAALALLATADPATDRTARELLEITDGRRALDLSDLSPAEQAELIAGRCQQLQPSAQALAERVASAAAEGRRFVAKFGIDPTGAEVHLGHAVPMLLLSRFARMGHRVVFIVGDTTAKIGDPSGRSDERPPLTDADIARNLSTYRDQVSPFFDFTKAEFRRNGDWLNQISLPRLIEITAQIPVSMPLQRDDFRKRLDAGHGLSLAELLYSVAMALDSVEINCDLEVGGIDQYLNMQMCRKVMDVCGLTPELVAAAPLLEGTDGTGAKMSKSRGNYVPVTASPGEMFGKIMSVPDRAVEQYFRALSEWSDSELAAAARRLADGTLHPMDLKKLLAADITAAVHGVDAAMAARADFAARFSRRTFAAAGDLPVVSDLGLPVVEIVKALGFARTNGDVRRAAQQNGLRLVAEADGHQEQAVLTVEEIHMPLSDVAKARLGDLPGERFLKIGRKLARVGGPT